MLKRRKRHQNISMINDNEETTEAEVPRRVNKKLNRRRSTDELLVGTTTRTSLRKTTRSVERRR